MPRKDPEQRKIYGKKYRKNHPRSGTIRKKKWRLANRDHYLKSMKTTTQRNKLNWYKIIKELGRDKCSICGYSKCFAAVHYHHPDNIIKKYNPSDLFRRLPTI